MVERSMLTVGELFVWARSARSQAPVFLPAVDERYLLVGQRQAPRRPKAKPKVRRPPQARRGEAASKQIIDKLTHYFVLLVLACTTLI